MRTFLTLALLLLFLGASEAQQSVDETRSIAAGDPAMVQAVKRAQATLPAFLETSRHPKPGMEHFAVKIGLGPKDGVKEFFWLSPFAVTRDTLTGTLANEPEVVEGYQKGQQVSVPLSEVTDWMYVEGGRLRGNYSACVLYAREGPKSLAGFEQQYGADCSALK